MFSHSLSHSSQLMQTDITGLQMYYFFNIPKIPVAQPSSTLQVNPTWEARKGTTEHREWADLLYFLRPWLISLQPQGYVFIPGTPDTALFSTISQGTVCLSRCTCWPCPLT